MDLLSTYAHYSKKEKTTYLLLKFISKNRLHFNESQCLLPSITLIEISFFYHFMTKIICVTSWKMSVKLNEKRKERCRFVRYQFSKGSDRDKKCSISHVYRL